MPRHPRRPLWIAALACALGGLAVVVCEGRQWAAARVVTVTGARPRVALTGHAVAPSLSALGIALLAMAVAMLAGFGVMRRLAGLLTVLIGAGAVAVAVDGRGKVPATLAAKAVATQVHAVHAPVAAWWLLAALGGAVAAAAGAVVAARSGTWPGLGARYEPPAPARRPPGAAAADGSEPAGSDASVWDRLDRGDDPTV